MNTSGFFPDCHDINVLNSYEVKIDPLHMSSLAAFEKVALLLSGKYDQFIEYLTSVNLSTLTLQKEILFKSAIFKEIIKAHPIENDSYQKKYDIIDIYRDRTTNDIENAGKVSRELKRRIMEILKNIAI